MSVEPLRHNRLSDGTAAPASLAASLAPEALGGFLGGSETRLYRLLGAHVMEQAGGEGTQFAVWAPRAAEVTLIGSFNDWDPRATPLRRVGSTGVWAIFLPGVGPGAMYKYRVLPAAAARRRPAAASRRKTGRAKEPEVRALDKADPLGFAMELRPRSASIVVGPSRHEWSDGAWMAARAEPPAPARPISIYEVHLGSWRRKPDGRWLDYRELADELLPYVKELGFTHIELLPVTEHPYDPSWGYQTVGYFAPTSRFGTPDDLRAFVDAAHAMELGVIVDWVPAHFPLDEHGLALFDGEPLYEHADPKRGEHPDWGTAIFDYGRPEVASFLASSARYWLDEYHVDGLRVDAVASMLYLDYSREEGEWEPNVHGGRENLEAVEFLRWLNDELHAACPGALLCAEESTAWPRVTEPTGQGGLGFDLKWNMGWMNDTLRVFETEPRDRRRVHERLTFSIHYAFFEQFLLPLSHDEVVHLKRSLLSKMPGGYEQKFAGLRLLLGYMWAHPGKKLLFMGGELAQWTEWSENGELDWALLDFPSHRGIQDWVRALNDLYLREPALHALDGSAEGFEWVDAGDAERGILTFLRWAPGRERLVLVAANFSDRAVRLRVGVPRAGPYEIVLDSEAREFGGKRDHRTPAPATEVPSHGRPASLELDLRALSVLILMPSG